MKPVPEELIKLFDDFDGTVILLKKGRPEIRQSVDADLQIREDQGSYTIILEENSTARLLLLDLALNENDFSSINFKFILKPNSRIGITDIEYTSEGHKRDCEFIFNQEHSSVVEYNLLTLKNGISKNNITVNALGKNTVTKINGLALGSEIEEIHNTTNLLHKSDNGFSDQLFKYILNDNAHASFYGTITVEKNARFNEAYQNNKNIVLSEGARMHAKPQLVIYNDDVKCSHGAATGQLDSRAIYYMQTRGVPREEAQAMLLQAFMIDIIERMEDSVIKEAVIKLIDEHNLL